MERKTMRVSNMRKSSCDYRKLAMLMPGQVERMYFFSLVDICSVTNPNMVAALEQVLVFGKARKEVCKDFNVSASYLSIKLRQLQGLNTLLQDMFPCAQKRGGCPLHSQEGSPEEVAEIISSE